MSRMHNPPHPGEFLRAVYFEPHGLSLNQVARQMGIAPSTLSRLLSGKSMVTSRMAIMLSQAFGRSPESWLNMQNAFDLWRERQGDNLPELERIELREVG